VIHDLNSVFYCNFAVFYYIEDSLSRAFESSTFLLKMIHAAQIRAARALLNWRQEDLARHGKIAIATIQRIEKTDGPVMGNVSTQIRIQQAFERAGIRFIDADDAEGVGVRLASSHPKKSSKTKG
jgi:hypothetical protein